jgi:outer membrane cobalamin receptor
MRNFYNTIFLICSILLALKSVSGYSQSKISGQVKDDKGKPLPYASIYIEKTIDGTTTDSLGRYSFKTNEKGKHILVASFVGYETMKDTIVIDKKVISHDMKVKENTISMQEVVVTAGAFEANDDQKVAILKPLDIYVNAGAGGDIMGAIRSLPGTQAQGDQTGLFVRGGDASESNVVIDGMVVQNPFTSNVPGVSQRSRFMPFQFKGISFSSGGYSAKYGQALSSILELNTFDMPESSNINVSTGMTGIAASGTKKWNSQAFELTGHYDNLRPFFNLAKTNFHFYDAPVGGGFSGKYTVLGTKKDLLKIFFKYDYSSSGTDVANPFSPGNTIPFGLKNNNSYFNSSYNHLFDKLVFRTAVSASNNNDKINWDTIPGSNNDWRIQGRAEALYNFTEKINVLFGTEINRYQFKQGYNTSHAMFNESLTAGYLEGEWKPARWLAVKPGVRFEHSALLAKNNFGPRLAMAVGTGQYSQISLAGGVFYQDPDKKYLLANYRPDFQKAVHYIMNYQVIKNDRTFRIEGYYKSYDQLVRELIGQYNPNYYRFVSGTVNNSGNGYAKGLEIFWRDKATINNFDYWVSYSYIDTKRLYENFLSKATPSFAAKNNLNVLAKYFIEPLQVNVGISYTYASGRPYYNPASSTFLGDRTPSYQDVAMNASYLLTVGKYFAVAYISVDNVAGRRNIYGYSYSYDVNTNSYKSYPIIPPLYRWFYAGFTISLSKFKKEEL